MKIKHTLINLFGLASLALCIQGIASENNSKLINDEIDRYGFTLLKEKRYEEALNWINTILDNNHKNANALRFKGDVFYFMGNYPSALKLYQSVVHIYQEQKSLDSNDNLKFVSAIVRTAYVYEKLGQYNSAITKCREVLRIQPSDFDCLWTLVRAHSALGDVQSAIIFSDTLISAYPNSSLGYELRRLFNVEAGEFSKALVLSEKIVKLNPSSGYPYFIRGKDYLSLNRLGEALEDFRIVLKLSKKDAPHYIKAKNFVDQLD